MGREKWLKLWTKGLTYQICSELKFDDYFCELQADGLFHLDMKSQFQNKSPWVVARLLKLWDVVHLGPDICRIIGDYLWVG